MSLTIKQIKWDKIGSIATPSEAGVLRFTSTNDSAGNISFSGGGSYRDFGFFYNQNTGTFSSITDYSQTISQLLSAFPISDSGNLAYRTQPPSTIFVRYLGTTYTLHTGTVGGVGGLDANPELNIAYSFGGSGGSGKFLKYGKFLKSIVQPGFGDLGSFTDTGLLGPVSISRNGLFVTVAGVPSGGTSSNTIKVYTTSNGLPPPQNYFTIIQAGNTITIPGTQSISEVKINNAGTRLVAYNSSNIYTYELISGSWVERPALASPASNSGTGISLSSVGDIMVTRGNSVAVSYSWNSDSKSWSLQDVTNIFYPTGFSAYQGSTIDISADGQYMAVDMWPTTNSTAIEIYKSTITDVTYDAPVITPGQTFTLPENRIFSGTPAVLNDGLIRQVSTWSATGLPDGLSINSTTGEITGTPTAQGEFTATITATGPGGSSTEAIGFSVIDNFPLYRGATRGLAIYAGAAEGKAIYYGSKKLWP